MEQELIAEFANNNFTVEGDDTAAKCAALCLDFRLAPAELIESWELFYLNMRLDNGKVESRQLDKFKQFLQSQQKEAAARRKSNDFYLYSKNDIDTFDSEDDTPTFQRTPLASRSRETQMDIDHPDAAPKTPASVTSKSIAKEIRSKNSPLTPFSQRSTKGTTQFVLNGHLPEFVVEEKLGNEPEDDILRRLPPIGNSHLTILGSPLKPGCRFMYDRMEDKLQVLEKRLQRFGEILAEHESLNVYNHVALASQEQVFVVGMVACDGEGHLNDKSLLLQGSVEHSGGHRVRLDVSNLSNYSLFPGQIVGVEGYNPSGHCLVASRVVDAIPFPGCLMVPCSDEPSSKRHATQSMPKESLSFRHSSSISIVIAGGPFTTSDNLAFEPLEELLDVSRKKRANVLLLMGPFVDSEHPQIKLGTMDRSFSQIFQDEVKVKIQDYCQEMGSGARVVLVPSTRDVHHDLLFPQPPFGGHAFDDLGHQISLLANPGLFQVNKIKIGCCTIDILRHLSSEEISKVPAGVPTDRLARLASHLIGQHSFYPLFPSATGVPLDLSLSEPSMALPCKPDILVLLSDLAPFVKVLHGDVQEKNINDGCICINPGRLSKGMNGGTFSHLVLHTSPSSSSLEVKEENLEERTRVSIIRI